jgi:hypothetical protein
MYSIEVYLDLLSFFIRIFGKELILEQKSEDMENSTTLSKILTDF